MSKLKDKINGTLHPLANIFAMGESFEEIEKKYSITDMIKFIVVFMDILQEANKHKSRMVTDLIVSKDEELEEWHNGLHSILSIYFYILKQLIQETQNPNQSPYKALKSLGIEWGKESVEENIKDATN